MSRALACLLLILLARCSLLPAARGAEPPGRPPERAALAAAIPVQELPDPAAQTSDSQATAALALADQALAAAKEAKDTAREARAQRERARWLEELHRAGAAAAWEQAAACCREVGDGPGQVEALAHEAILLGDKPEANARLETAVALARAETKRPLEAAARLNEAGWTFNDLARYAEARTAHAAALAVQQRAAPNSLDVARSLNGLGITAYYEGDLAGATAYYQRALAIREKRAPDSLVVADSLNNLGLMARAQGDLAGAQELDRRALALYEKLAPNSLDVATSLNNAGIVAHAQGDLAGAQGLYQRALALYETLAPNSLAVALSFNNLGNVASDRDDLAGAKECYQRALAIQEELAPDSVVVATSLDNLGMVSSDQGDLAGAKVLHQRALVILEKRAPNSLMLATSLDNLGRIADRQGDLAGAAALARRAWAIVRAQSRAMSGDEAHQAFSRFTAFYAAQLLRYQLALGQTESALVTLEEGRAQSLQQLLQERGLTRAVLAGRHPELWHAYEEALNRHNTAGKSLERAYAAESRAEQALQAEQESQAGNARVREKEGALRAAQGGVAQAQGEETRTRLAEEAAWAAVKASAPQAFPPLLDPAVARERLPAGTLFAAFSVGDTESRLFLVRRGAAPQVFPIAVSLKELTARVRFVRKSLCGEEGGRAAVLATDPELAGQKVRELFQLLFPPGARAQLARSRRLVLAPDGPLWELPFAALITNEGGKPAYLGLQHPLVYAQSLTLYVQSLQEELAVPRSGLDALVIGDPLFDTSLEARQAALAEARRYGAIPGVESRPVGSAGPKGKLPRIASRERGERALLTRDGTVPTQLPAAAAEAAAVARLYHAPPHLGVEPTEAWFRSQASAANLIHLATHGYLHPQRATSSGVLLAVPSRPAAESDADTDNDGALQAWELFQFPTRGLPLHAELVVLSACETGRGAEVTGEGLVGLTRAWQVAGARSIVASQWKVADASTSALMVRFHQELRAGKAKDEALQAAMAAVAGDRAHPEWARPYFWAPFLLAGDPENHRLGMKPPRAR